MKRIALPVLFAALLFVALSAIASACTVTTNCNNGCEIDIFCPRPYPHCELYCNAPSQTLSCSGSVCSGNSHLRHLRRGDDQLLDHQPVQVGQPLGAVRQLEHAVHL
jgi:hypothetical protein